MALVRLSIEPTFVGPMSSGTVAVIRALQSHLSLSLQEAKQYVERCVFGAETVGVPAPSKDAAQAAVNALQALEAPTVLNALVVDE